MMYSDYGFFGMHMMWWFFWILIMFVMFGWFEPVPKKRVRRDSPFDILQKRFASGDITVEEYQETKRILDDEVAKDASLPVSSQVSQATTNPGQDLISSN